MSEYRVALNRTDGTLKIVAECDTLPQAKRVLGPWRVALRKMPEWDPRILDKEGNEVKT